MKAEESWKISRASGSGRNYTGEVNSALCSVCFPARVGWSCVVSVAEVFRICVVTNFAGVSIGVLRLIKCYSRCNLNCHT